MSVCLLDQGVSKTIHTKLINTSIVKTLTELYVGAENKFNDLICKSAGGQQLIQRNYNRGV